MSFELEEKEEMSRAKKEAIFVATVTACLSAAIWLSPWSPEWRVPGSLFAETIVLFFAGLNLV